LSKMGVPAVGVQAQASNRQVQLWSKALVVTTVA
jgi:hypothetical protein